MACFGKMMFFLAACSIVFPRSIHGVDVVRDMPPLVEDFAFEMLNLYSDREGGMRLSIYVKFRYGDVNETTGLSDTAGTFSFVDMKNLIMQYVPAGGGGVGGDAYSEFVTRAIAQAVWQEFPVAALSIAYQVQGMSGGEANHRTSIVTIGVIEPWSLPVQFGTCDGMSMDESNPECMIQPMWNVTDPTPPEAVAKAGQHDKPSSGQDVPSVSG